MAQPACSGGARQRSRPARLNGIFAALLERAAREGTLPDMPLYRAAEVLHASGTAILPALHLDEFGQTAPDGTAVFANSQLSCFLDGSGIGGGAVGA